VAASDAEDVTETYVIKLFLQLELRH